MSLAPAKNPVPKKVWKEIKEKLAQYGVAIQENHQRVVVDEVGDEYASFAALYAKE